MSKDSLLFSKLRRRLLVWYSRHKRDLPWRHTRDPYKIWVSEIMLQQTQVATVIPYYKRWLRAFPSLKVLAHAPLAKALKLWAGLGYYRRARMLHQAARYVQKEFRGKIPGKAEDLKKLPGIGRYTAGAIASIAWGERTPVLDGNVIRILTRIFAISRHADKSATLKKLWKIADSLLPGKNPGDFNQAMMELGATVCLASAPECFRCPVEEYCLAHQKGKALAYPAWAKKEHYEKLEMTALALMHPQGKMWLEKQPEHGRWGGLWMFPFWENGKEMLKDLKLSGLRPDFFMIVRHSFTKYRITLKVFTAMQPDTISDRSAGRWFSIAELTHIACPSPHRKIIRALIEYKKGFASPFSA